MAVKAKDTPSKTWKTQRLNPLVRLPEGERAKLITALRAFLQSRNATGLNTGLVALFLLLCLFKKQSNNY